MRKLFIAGEYVDPVSDRVIVVENPATEETIAEVPDAGAADVDRAVQAARAAQRSWRKVDGLARAGLLHAARTASSATRSASRCSSPSRAARPSRRTATRWSGA